MKRDDNSSAWLPIDTAPCDGTAIQLLGQDGNRDVGEWYEFRLDFDRVANGFAEDETGEFSSEFGEGPFTHWMPIDMSISWGGK